MVSDVYMIWSEMPSGVLRHLTVGLDSALGWWLYHSEMGLAPRMELFYSAEATR